MLSPGQETDQNACRLRTFAVIHKKRGFRITFCFNSGFNNGSMTGSRFESPPRIESGFNTCTIAESRFESQPRIESGFDSEHFQGRWANSSTFPGLLVESGYVWIRCPRPGLNLDTLLGVWTGSGYGFLVTGFSLGLLWSDWIWIHSLYVTFLKRYRCR